MKQNEFEQITYIDQVVADLVKRGLTEAEARKVYGIFIEIWGKTWQLVGKRAAEAEMTAAQSRGNVSGLTSTLKGLGIVALVAVLLDPPQAKADAQSTFRDIRKGLNIIRENGISAEFTDPRLYSSDGKRLKGTNSEVQPGASGSSTASAAH